jgi:AmmeMemoRadiSam system protein B
LHFRPPAVAGSWYPGTAPALAAAVDGYLTAAASDRPHGLVRVTALVAPHAGLKYSGPVAAHAYRCLPGLDLEVVVLVGPSHFVAFDGVSIIPAGQFDTPLGAVEIDEACGAAIMAATHLVREYPAPHAREHSLELQLPFLRRVAPQAAIVPLLMGEQTAEAARELGRALGVALRGRRALVVASTDLSHYQNAVVAARLDGLVIEAVSRFDPDGLQELLDVRPDHACGGGPAVAVMRAALLLGARKAVVLKYADSGDVSGDKSAVVGYLAAAFGQVADESGPTPLEAGRT